MLRACLTSLLADLRPNAVALVDAFDFPDAVLDSVLGRWDGQVYQALYDFALDSSMNEKQVSEVVKTSFLYWDMRHRSTRPCMLLNSSMNKKEVSEVAKKSIVYWDMGRRSTRHCTLLHGTAE